MFKKKEILNCPTESGFGSVLSFPQSLSWSALTFLPQYKDKNDNRHHYRALPLWQVFSAFHATAHLILAEAPALGFLSIPVVQT